MTFVDGTGVTVGSEKCRCGDECEFPCWQRIGIAPPCGECRCPDWPDAGEREGFAFMRGRALGRAEAKPDA